MRTFSLIALSLLLSGSAFAGKIELTDIEGRTIQATPVGIADGNVTIIGEDGVRYMFPLNRLSLESLERVRLELANDTTPAPSAPAPKPAKPKPAKPASKGLAFKTNFKFDGEPPARMTARLMSTVVIPGRRSFREQFDPRSEDIPVAAKEDSDYTLTLIPDGYVRQSQRVTIRDGKLVPDTITATFRKCRYVIIRYAVNISGEADFSSAADLSVETGTAAFTDSSHANPKHFLGFRLVQVPGGKRSSDDTFLLDWTFHAKGGVRVRGGGFDSILTSKTDAYKVEDLPLKKGMVFTCQSTYSRNPYYAKFEIIDIVDKLPDGMMVY